MTKTIHRVKNGRISGDRPVYMEMEAWVLLSLLDTSPEDFPVLSRLFNDDCEDTSYAPSELRGLLWEIGRLKRPVEKRVGKGLLRHGRIEIDPKASLAFLDRFHGLVSLAISNGESISAYGD